MPTGCGKEEGDWGVKPDPQAHLPSAKTLSCFGELGRVILAKGVARPALEKAVTTAIQLREPCQTLSHLQ